MRRPAELRDDIVELFPRAESWSFPPKKYVGKMKEPGEHDRLLTTFLAGLRCSERDRLLTTFLAGLRFQIDGAVLQSPSGMRCCKARRTSRTRRAAGIWTRRMWSRC